MQSLSSIKKFHENTLAVATKQLNKFFNLKLKQPILMVKADEGTTAQTIKVNREKCVLIRPLRYIQKDTVFPTGIIIHELAHCFEPYFLLQDENRNTLPPIYLHEGFAEWVSVDDPANIFEELNLNKRLNSNDRLRKEIEIKSDFGKVQVENLYLSKLYATPRLEKTEFDSFIPYWVGSSLIQYIFDKGGFDVLKEFMQKVQIVSKYDPGWIDSTTSISKIELDNEEKRVKSLLKETVTENFGDYGKFEEEWRDSILRPEKNTR